MGGGGGVGVAYSSKRKGNIIYSTPSSPKTPQSCSSPEVRAWQRECDSCIFFWSSAISLSRQLSSLPSTSGNRDYNNTVWHKILAVIIFGRFAFPPRLVDSNWRSFSTCVVSACAHTHFVEFGGPLVQPPIHQIKFSANISYHTVITYNVTISNVCIPYLINYVGFLFSIHLFHYFTIRG